jgi:hypothetical protein
MYNSLVKQLINVPFAEGCQCTLGKLPEGIKYALELLPEVIGQPFEIYTMYMPGAIILKNKPKIFKKQLPVLNYPI